MEMVATVKLKRYQGLMSQSAPYERSLHAVLSKILRTGRSLHHPLLETRAEKETALLVITSDTGLCGPFNHDLITAAKNFMKERPAAPLLIGIGKTGINALSRAGHTWHAVFKDTKTSQVESVIREVNRLTQDLFCEKKVDAVYAVHSHLETKTVSHPVVEKLLPFSFEPGESPAGGLDDYILEPDPESLFARLVPLVFESRLRLIFLESSVAEQTARMTAMHQATENASELVESLVLLRNKIRQAAITKELIEIVSGSRALKN